jgi:ribonuclease P protein component
LSDFVTLNRNGDFRRMYARGKVYTNPALVTYVMKNRAGICRIGITTSKKTGNAVERNRSKRIIREAFRAIRGEVVGSYDFVFVSRGKTKTLKSTDVGRVMHAQLKNAGVLSCRTEEKQ